MNKRRIVQKRTTFLQKAAYILRPFVVYMVVKTAAMLTLAILLPSLPIAGISVWVEEHSRMLSAAFNAAASLAGVSFLLRDFLKEASVSGEVDIDAGVLKQLLDFFKNSFLGLKSFGVCVLCAVFGVVSAFGLNALIGEASDFLTRVSQTQGALGSQKYEAVKQIQYSVPLLGGLVLYGVISPLVEEIVFRGVLFNRMKKFYSVGRAVVCSARLFGAFHGNLPQFVYGTCMGVLIALCYEWTGCFYAPLLFHAAANAAVFLAAGVAG